MWTRIVEESLTTALVTVTGKMSFKEFHELPILLYGDNIVQMKSFYCCTLLSKQKIPNFLMETTSNFMNSTEYKAEFRVKKQDLPRLVAALRLPPVLRCEQRSICDDIEGPCMFLKRVAYPCRLSDMIP